MAAHNPVFPAGVGNVVSSQWGASGYGLPGMAGSIFQFDSGWTLTYDTDGDLIGSSYSTPSPRAPAAAAVSTSTGVNPLETSYALYGHTIPLSCFGVGRIGGEIIGGPFIENGLATFCISFGLPADPYGNRTLKEIAFDSEVVWENGSFNTEAFTFRFYSGRLDQAIDPIETAHYGADAIAYRPQMLIWFENLPLANTKFQKIPYVAAVISDNSGEDVNLGEAFERIAYSPWCNYTPADFESQGVTDGLVHGGLIIAQDAEFLGLIQQFNRFYRNWNVLQTDKLRIADRGAHVTPDVVLDCSMLTSQVMFSRAEPTSVPRVLQLSTIDPDADYTIVPSTAVRTLEPVNVSASVKTELAFLPIIMDLSVRMSVVTYTKYLEDVARKKISLTAMMRGLQIEPGDFISIAELGARFADNTFKVTETSHGANYTVEITAESFFNCRIPNVDLYWDHVVLLLGFEDVDGSTGAPGLTDESPAAHGTGTASGVTATDTAQLKFGSSSLRVNNSRLSFIPDTDWWLSVSNSDQFTVECWVRFNSLSVSVGEVIVGSSLIDIGWFLGVATSHEIVFGFSPGLGGSVVNIFSSGAAIATGIWYHLAADKDATGKIRVYKNGVMMGSATPADSSFITNASFDLDIGTIGLFGSNPTDGWVDEIRITKGIARYASDGGFVVPTLAYPRSGV